MANSSNTKVLYLGVYRDATGWGQAARDYILAMDSVGIDVIPRPIKLDNSLPELPERLLELEKKSAAGCNIVIQHILPNMMSYDGHFERNIALFASETSNFSDSNWTRSLNLMDEIWVINKLQAQSCLASGVDKAIHVVPHVANLEKYEKDYPAFELPSIYHDRCIFYFVGEFSRRKNVAALIKAFYSEFDRRENVTLLLKLNKPGVSPPELAKEVQNFCLEIKKGLKKYVKEEMYQGEIVITDFLTEEQLHSLHQRCDVFVNPSYGEAWCLPAFDALAHGNPVISSDCGGPSDYLPNTVKSEKDIAFGVFDSFPNLYTSNELWLEVNVSDLGWEMRKWFEKWKSEDNMKYKTGFIEDQFSYKKIGNRIKHLLESGCG